MVLRYDNGLPRYSHCADCQRPLDEANTAAANLRKCVTCHMRTVEKTTETWRHQLRLWAVDDAVNVLREEQPEHFAYNVASVGDATPGGLDTLDTWLARWMNDGCDPIPGVREGERAEPSPRDYGIYREAYSNALRAGIEACEKGCDSEFGYDPDAVTEAAVEAAEGTL